MNQDTESIWRACSSELKAFIVKRVSNASFADDILQEVFIKIHEKIDTLKDSTKINSWIYQITRNAIVDYYRKRKVELLDLQLLSDTELGIAENSKEQNEENPQTRAALGLHLMVDALPEKYAQALRMVELNGLSQVQLAKELNISVSAAKSRVQRGRQMLKDSLMQCCHYEFDTYGTILSSHPITCCCCHQYFEHTK